MLEKLKAWFYSILSFGCMTLFALTGIAFLEWLEKMWYRACGNGLLEYCLKSLKSPWKVLEYKVINPVWTCSYYSTSITTQPTPPSTPTPTPTPTRKDKMCPVKAIFYCLFYVQLWTWARLPDTSGKGAWPLLGEERRADSGEWWKSSLLWMLSTIICDTLISFL